MFPLSSFRAKLLRNDLHALFPAFLNESQLAYLVPASYTAHDELIRALKSQFVGTGWSCRSVVFRESYTYSHECEYILGPHLVLTIEECEGDAVEQTKIPTKWLMVLVRGAENRCYMEAATPEEYSSVYQKLQASRL